MEGLRDRLNDILDILTMPYRFVRALLRGIFTWEFLGFLLGIAVYLIIVVVIPSILYVAYLNF